jgi:glycosyltransferase involved in cell wall biosynthesis
VLVILIISCSLDSSLALAKLQGNLQSHRERYYLFNDFDQVVLLTQDVQGFGNELGQIIHVPCAHSRFKIVETLVSRFKFLRWIRFSRKSFIWLLRNRAKIYLVLSENVDSLTPFLFSSLFRIPYYIHYHYDVATQVSKINKRCFEGILLILLEKLCFRRATCIWVTAENLAEKAKSYGANKVAFMPNWVDLNVTPKNLLEDSVESKDRILFVGRLHPVKRVDLLLEAFARLRRVRPNASLSVIGDGVERKNLVSLTGKLELGSSVKFLGFQIHEKVISIMKDSDLFVLPSKIEGNPRVLIEAMSVKLPLVATDVLGIRDMVHHGETGHLVQPFPEDLAMGMEYVLKHNEYALKITENAYAFAQEHFSRARLAEKIKMDLTSSVPQYRKKFG